jgi:hypothetical protein
VKIRSITLEGDTGYTCKISHITSHAPAGQKPIVDFIRVAICDDSGRAINTHNVSPTDPENQFSMAQCIQYHLDGCKGTNSMIHGYFRELQRLAD